MMYCPDDAAFAAMQKCIGFDDKFVRPNTKRPHYSRNTMIFYMPYNTIRVRLPDTTWTQLYRLGYADHGGIRHNPIAGVSYADFYLTPRGLHMLGYWLGGVAIFKARCWTA